MNMQHSSSTTKSDDVLIFHYNEKNLKNQLLYPRKTFYRWKVATEVKKKLNISFIA